MTRSDAPVRPPVVLTIAGSDAGGGAGIQADLKTIEAGEAFGTSAITSVTAQNTTGVHGQHLLPIDDIEAQIQAVVEDFELAAVKTGMLATAEVVDLVVDHADALPNLVVDPVMVAASGDRLLDPAAESAYESLIAESGLVTPNADEAAVLTDRDVERPADAEAAGRDLVEMGAAAALVKGGHVPGDQVVDTLVTEETVTTLRHDRVETEATHGSGCTLSAAIATRLAHGADLKTAVADGIDLLARAVRHHLAVGQGPGAVHHMVGVRNEASRHLTGEAVQHAVDDLVTGDATPLLPDAGMTVVGATPYAETPAEVAAVEGRIGSTLSGPRPNRGVRFGADTQVASALLGARETIPSLRFGLTCRHSEAVIDALSATPMPIIDLEAPDGPDTSGHAALADRVAAALDPGTGSPLAVVDAPAVGQPGTVLVLAETGQSLSAAALALLDEVE